MRVRVSSRARARVRGRGRNRVRSVRDRVRNGVGHRVGGAGGHEEELARSEGYLPIGLGVGVGLGYG